MAIDDYLHAVYSMTYGERTIEFSFARSSLAGADPLILPIPGTWAVISARNPMSVALEEAENQDRDRRLATMLREQGAAWNPAEGRSSDGKWREPSSVVWGLTCGAAREIGRRFEQRAVVWGSNGLVGMLDCLTERLVCRPVHGRFIDKAGSCNGGDKQP